MPLHGKKRHLRRSDLVDYYGRERLGLPPAVIDDVLSRLLAAQDGWLHTITASFLPEAAQSRYLGLLQERRERLFGAAR